MWYENYGYTQNPFAISSFKESNEFIGREDELNDAIYYISSGSIVFIECEKGNGRTRFLKEIIDNFRGKIIYVDARKIKKNLDIEDLLKTKNGVVGKVFSKLPTNMILLIDNVEELSPVNLERLKFFFDKNNLRSIVFVGESIQKSILPDCLKHRIGKRIISLPNLSEKEIVDIIYSRLETNPKDSLIDEELVKDLYIFYNYNLKKLLISCNSAAQKMVEEKEERIEAKHFRNIRPDFDVNEFVNESLIDDDGNTIVKIGQYYRNSFKDSFCSNCGAIVCLTDNECPECGLEFEKEKPKKANKEVSKKPIKKNKNKKEKIKSDKKVTSKKNKGKKSSKTIKQKLNKGEL